MFLLTVGSHADCLTYVTLFCVIAPLALHLLLSVSCLILPVAKKSAQPQAVVQARLGARTQTTRKATLPT